MNTNILCTTLGNEWGIFNYNIMVWKFFHLINFSKTNNRQFTKLLLPINKCIASSLAAHWKSLQARLCKSGLWAANFGRANATAGNFDEVAKVIAGVPGIRRNSAAVSSLSSSSPGCWFQRRIDDRKKKWGTFAMTSEEQSADAS